MANPIDAKEEDKHISGCESNRRNAAEVPLGQEKMVEHEAGKNMKHRHDADEHHLYREPFDECGLQEDQRRAACDGDESRRRSQLDIYEPRDAVQPVELGTDRERAPLPEQERQHDEPTRPDRDRGQMDELQDGCHSAGSPARSEDHVIQSPAAR